MDIFEGGLMVDLPDEKILLIFSATQQAVFCLFFFEVTGSVILASITSLPMYILTILVNSHFTLRTVYDRVAHLVVVAETS